MADIPPDLPARVLRWARSLPGMEGPARLLVISPWLKDATFVDDCIVLVDEDLPRPLAVIDWIAVADFIDEQSDGDATELDALRTAVELAGRTRGHPAP